MFMFAEVTAKGNQDGGSGLGLLFAGLFVLVVYCVIFGKK